MKSRWIAAGAFAAICVCTVMQWMPERPTAPGTVRWRVRTGLGQEAWPAASGGVVYAAKWGDCSFWREMRERAKLWTSRSPTPMPPWWEPTGPFSVVAIDAGTGRRRWESAYLRSWPISPLVPAGDTLLVGASVDLFALDTRTGHGKWGFAFHATPKASASAEDGMMYCATATGINALDLATGREKWLSSAHPIVIAAPRLGRDNLFLGDRAGKLYALDKRTGALRWTANTEQGWCSTPVLASSRVAIATTRTIYCYDALNGTPNWTRSLGPPAILQLAAEPNMLYVAHGTTLVSLDIATGDVRWSLTGQVSPSSCPAVMGDTVYAACGKDLVAIESSVGQVVWRVSADANIAGPIVASEGTVFFLTDSGYLYAVNAEPEKSPPLPRPSPK